MTAEVERHNDAILSQLDFATTLAEYQRGERITGRGNVFINLICLLLYLRKTEEREWPHAWIIKEIGEPDRTDETAGWMEMHYRMKYPECTCEREHWAELRLKDGHLVGMATY
ncbi:MAG: hypothetical protein A2498_06800 [Lentisphaerae bacterium RIFOXYC12_FULL_60_16]|nr:MAG: hypothetical protein A2498_06800 [Lentisphaerae bacterium RIFOXYC12_FULL_60_16]OGV73527.1 MAG: hypothetical protein A2269_03040 [Lentisphaerae bacterium RIFOXYA12_FULL_60_10]OGV75743.1 MAG: hypothetical protein A2340_09795 [Lentisphaerae bacterium RIFOXYB12_FULL_60_10]